jgi:hypothetical protein
MPATDIFTLFMTELKGRWEYNPVLPVNTEISLHTPSAQRQVICILLWVSSTCFLFCLTRYLFINAKFAKKDIRDYIFSSAKNDV